MKLVYHWIILSIAVFATSYLLPGRIVFQHTYTALVVAACLVFVNAIVKPVILLLTLPLNIMTLGLFSLLINGAIFWSLTNVISGFTIVNFSAAFIGALIISVINGVVSTMFGHV